VEIVHGSVWDVLRVEAVDLMFWHTSLWKCAVTLFLVGLLIALTGCATILQGPYQRVVINSEPDGAEIRVNNIPYGRTPSVVPLARNGVHMIEFSKAGYRPQLILAPGRVGGGWIVLDILSGLLPLAVDASSGRWRSFDSHIFANLPSVKDSTDASPGDGQVVPPVGLPSRQVETFLAPGKLGFVIANRTVTRVHVGSPAQLAGMRLGDKILAANDQQLTGDDDGDRAIVSGPPGSTVPLKLLRNGQEMTIIVRRTAASVTPE